jgi:predicted transposase YdaD
MAPQLKSEILSTYDQIKIEGKLEGIIEGKLEGKIEGKLEGKLEGMIEAKSEVVINLADAGMDVDFIVKVTELSRETVEKIIREKE